MEGPRPARDHVGRNGRRLRAGDADGGNGNPHRRILVSRPGCRLFSDAGRGFDKIFGNYRWRNFTADLGRLSPRPELRIHIGNPYPQGGEAANRAVWV